MKTLKSILVALSLLLIGLTTASADPKAGSIFIANGVFSFVLTDNPEDILAFGTEKPMTWSKTSVAHIKLGYPDQLNGGFKTFGEGAWEGSNLISFPYRSNGGLDSFQVILSIDDTATGQHQESPLNLSAFDGGSSSYGTHWENSYDYLNVTTPIKPILTVSAVDILTKPITHKRIVGLSFKTVTALEVVRDDGNVIYNVNPSEISAVSLLVNGENMGNGSIVDATRIKFPDQFNPGSGVSFKVTLSNGEKGTLKLGNFGDDTEEYTLDKINNQAFIK